MSFLLALSTGCGKTQQFNLHESKAAQTLVEMGATIIVNSEGEVELVSFQQAQGRFTPANNITVTDDALKHLSSFKSLRRLELPPTTSNEGLKQIAGLTSLEELHLLGSRYQPSVTTSVSSTSLVHMKDMVNLRELWFPSGYRIEDNSDLAHLRNLKNLQSMSYDFSRQITDEGLEHLSALKSLQRLNLQDSEITDQGLVHVEKMKGLKELSLYGTKVSPTAVKRLKSALPECDVLEP